MSDGAFLNDVSVKPAPGIPSQPLSLLPFDIRTRASARLPGSSDSYLRDDFNFAASPNHTCHLLWPESTERDGGADKSPSAADLAALLWPPIRDVRILTLPDRYCPEVPFEEATAPMLCFE
jgi:hypothetical protein